MSTSRTPNSSFGYRPVYTASQVQSLSRVNNVDVGADIATGAVLVWSNSLNKWVYSPNTAYGAGTQRFYQDTPPPGNNGETFYVPLKQIGKLTEIRVRWDLPFSTDTALIRFWRYRKVDGVFSYTQITDGTTFDSSYDWSVWHDISDTIRNFDLDPETDMVAVTNVYTPGGSPTVRALNVTFTIEANELNEASSLSLPAVPVLGSTFPPV